MNKNVIIVAGGTGTRMESLTPKQFLLLGGLPVLMHCVNAFFQYDNRIRIIIALPVQEKNNWKQLCEKFRFVVPHQVTPGGEHRFHSVKNALQVIDDDGLVAIHDGVRPLVSVETIRNCFEKAEELGNAIPVTGSPDSVRLLNGSGSRQVDRSDVKLVQTPQVFRCSLIREAYKQNYSSRFTDDAAVFESAGGQINLVEGNPENIKITRPSDMLIAGSLLNFQSHE